VISGLFIGAGMRSRRLLPGDVVSVAFGINDNGQVVGESCPQKGNCRVFVWQNGVMTDLNTLIPPGSTVCMLVAAPLRSFGP